MNKKNQKFNHWREIVSYDETSPSCLRWKIGRGNQIKAGDSVGTLNEKLGYWMFSSTISGKSKMYYCHRIIWELFNGPINVKMQIDHKNINRSDNLILNLRLVTRKRNLRNSHMSSRNKSGVTGVFQNKGYWIAHWVTLEGQKRSKSFSTKKLGHEEAKQAAILYREQQICQLNSTGAGYTELHGLRRKE